jgi:ABC-type branched-subunit amino acid transport system ATPase component/predicted MFS family arabinose efflux permease
MTDLDVRPPTEQDDSPTESGAAPPRSRAATLVASVRGFRPTVITGGAAATPMLVMFGLNAVDELDGSAFRILLPEIRDWFGISLTSVTLLTTVVGLFGIFFAIPIGYLSDRLNRVHMTVLGAVVWGVFSFTTGLAPTVWWLGFMRFGSGLGKTLAPAYQSLLADYYPPHVRAGVFSFHQLANSVGQFAGPILAGLLATWVFWQAPFFLFAFPSLALAAFAFFRLREPVRGEQERRALGASEEVAMMKEKPPSISESWRIAKGVRTLRRIWMALPFIVGAGAVIATLMPLYYDEVFGVSASGRGFIAGFGEPFQIAGLIIGGVLGNRFLRYRPGRIITYIGGMAMLGGGLIALAAMAPVLSMAVGINWGLSFINAIFAPATGAITTLVIPPRARGFALSLTVIFVVPGLLITPLGGLIGDAYGLRYGILVMVPVYLIGAAIITTAGPSVEADIRAAQAAAMAATESRESAERGETKLLVCRDVDVHYGQVQILFNVDFDVTEGELIALLGTNGAGKSTLLRAISGLTAPSNGAIFYEGEDITFLPPSAHAARGIVQVPGGRGVFPGLSVRENLRLAAWLYRSDDEYVRTATEDVLERFPRLRERIDADAGALSGGEQQMLALSQAFLSRPKLLMIDELSLGLAPSVVEQLLGIVRAIHEQGTTIILVEQSVNIALTVAERAVFMEKGEVKFSGRTEDLLAREDVLRAVFVKGSAATGGTGTQARLRRERERAARERETVLAVRDVSHSFGGVRALDEVELTLDAGDILGLIGPNGAGKTTLFDVISGYVVPDRGEVTFFGDDVTELSPDARSRLGLHRSFQDALLFPSLTVVENLAVALDQHLVTRSAVAGGLHLPNARNAERRASLRVDSLVELLGLGDYRNKFVRELSTGTRRIVDMACVLATAPQVLLLDEPSSGVAQRETESFPALIQRIKTETGCSILIIEHDMPLITAVSDELVALNLGRIVTRGRPDEVLEHPDVVASYLGTTEETIRRSGAIT